MKRTVFCKSNVFLLMFVFLLSIIFSLKYITNAANEGTPNIGISTNVIKYEAFVGDEVSVKYTVTPKPISVSDINVKNSKEIVLVIDTSGSMDKELGKKFQWDDRRGYWEASIKKIQALKDAAKNFVDKFENDRNVKIGIVTYDTSAKRYMDLTEMNNSYTIKQYIENIRVDGATNVGDGIRVALGMFSDSKDISKYMVLMTDGMPTALSYTGMAGGNYMNNLNNEWQRYLMNNLKREDYYLFKGEFQESGVKYLAEYNYYYNKLNLFEYEGQYGNNIYNWNKCFDTNGWWYYTNDKDDSGIKYGSYRDADPKEYCLEYSKLMAQEAKKRNITNYFIAFSNESDRSKLMQIKESAGGAYFDAKDADAINSVYSKIGDEIKQDYAVANANIEFKLPDGIRLSDNQPDIKIQDGMCTKSLKDIVYKLNSNKTQYEASAFEINLKLKGIKKTDNGIIYGNLSYEDKNKRILNKPLPNVTVNIKDKEEIGFDISREVVPGGKIGSFNINQEFGIEYTITPKPIKLEKKEEPKEIMLVVDTSGSMKWLINSRKEGNPNRMYLTKKALKNFVDKFKDRKDVRIGLTTYIDESKVYNFNSVKFESDGGDKNNDSSKSPEYFVEASNTAALYSAIDALEAGGATNIGEGLRKGAGALDLDKGYKKYLVLMSDGEPTTYSCITSYDDYNMDISINNEKKVHYINDTETGRPLDYSKRIANQIKSMDIKTFSIGFSTEANVNKLKEIADSAGGSYEDATANDVNAINNVYMAIADKIQADFTLDNVVLTENLQPGLEFIDNGSGSFIQNLKVDYTYNKETNQYEAKPIKTTIKVKGKKIGKYELIDDAKVKCETINYNESFKPLEINITDACTLKQGLFEPGGGEEGMPGENNIKYINGSINVVSDAMIRAGAFVKTTGEETTISIDINNSKNSEFQSIDNLCINVYRVNDKGTLQLINDIAKVEVNKNGTNYVKMNVALPKGVGGDNYYIVNYNFSGKVQRENVSITNLGKIQGSDRQSQLNINFAGLPDLF